MTTMITEVYDALVSAGADDAKARRAAEVMAGHEDRFDRLEHRLDATETRLNHRFDALETKLTQQIESRYATLSQQIESGDAKLGQRIDAVEAKLSQQIESGDAKLGQRIDAVEAKLDVVKADLAGRINLLQWQLALLIGGVTAIVLRLFLH